MRLIDADAEIAKIEQEIQKIKSRIKEWEENREDRGGYHNVDGKISQFKSNILQAQTEIECLKRYSTAFDVGKIMEQFEQEIKEHGKVHSLARFEWLAALEMVKAAIKL